MLTVACIALLAVAALAHEPSEAAIARRRIRRWRRDRLVMPTGNRRR